MDPITYTTVYTLPTTGDAFAYQRMVTSGDIIIAGALWALVVLFLFVIIRMAVRGQL